MNIEKIFEYEMDQELRLAIQRLLVECFEESYPRERIYFKQLPHFRLLALTEKNQLIGQVGLDYRVMNLNGMPIKVLGIIDLCVSREARSQGIGNLLLSEIENFCEGKSIDFLLLFADNKSLYLKKGYKSVENKCKWLKIDEQNQTTFSIGNEVINELMIKELGNVKWQDGELDLLGYLY
ncbi:GNAT family N-acetyltransferase [Bacillus mycoides]|uniref:GNAT family N-acetyltransferase n=1 Tax=Bacillus mycoides TaxID=1405 RepID=A0A4U3AEZ9_BACMY|nr:GNAT family N-acetyltransferase [Bacillus mycoides]TKI86348.1 GNAT family N-acetyltransferase [Bacillus mycoides]